MNASVQQALQGVMALAQQSRFVEAKAACARILALHPNDPNACYIGGMLAFQTGETQRGIELMEKALRANPANAAGLYNLGVMLQAAGRNEDAVARYDQCLKATPAHAGAWNNRGNALSALGRMDDAIASFDRAIKLQANNIEALINKGGALLKAGRFDDAIACYDRVIAIRADIPEAHVGRGDVLLNLQRTPEAVASYDRALRLRPNYPEALKGRQLAAKGAAMIDGEIERLRALALANPQSADAQYEFASALAEGRRFEDALAACEAALALAPTASRAGALKAAMLVELWRHDEAVAAAQDVLTREPSNMDALFQRASALMLQGRVHDALVDLERLIAMEPALPRGPFAKALCCLLLGDFANGWPAYESRFDTANYRRNSGGNRALDVKPLRAPERSDVAGKRVLVLDEQGVGDTIMFASIIPDLVGVASRVDLVVEPRLVALLQHSFPAADVHGWPDLEAVVARESPDVRIMTGSLGHLFRRDAASFPGAPYLRADAQKRDAWRARLDARGRKIVGVSWRGGSDRTRADARSIGLADFMPVIGRDDFVCVSLQYGDVDADIAAFEKAHGRRVLHFPASETNDLDDLAALIAACDAVVTVQNTNVHLSGALGVPCYAIIPEMPEWRYQMSGAKLPWYGSVEVFRRRADLSLEALFEQITSRI